MRTASSILALAASALLSLPLAGCASWSTFPPVEGRDTFSPGLAPAPDVMAKSLAYAHARTGRGEPLLFNLPADVSAGTWGTVEIKLRPDGGVPMKPGDREVWSIQQVRLRGNVAEVDIVYLDQGVYQLATVHLSSKPFEPFRAEYLQRWLVPVETPVANDPRLAQPEAATEEPSPESKPASGDVGADDESAEHASEATGAEEPSEVAPVESGAFEDPASEPAASDEPAAAAFGPPAR
jgi:hypothetical protein